MGNSPISRSKENENVEQPRTPKLKKIKLNGVDPRSPTEGISRTPIVLDKSANDENFSPLTSKLPFDTSAFESIDGCLTDDESIHQAEMAAGDKALKKKDLLGRMRKSLRTHPGLLIQMRRKQKTQHDREQNEHADDASDNAVVDETLNIPSNAPGESEATGSLEQ